MVETLTLYFYVLYLFRHPIYIRYMFMYQYLLLRWNKENKNRKIMFCLIYSKRDTFIKSYLSFFFIT